MPESYGIYKGTVGEREYRAGVDEGRAAAEHDAREYPSTVWSQIEDARGELSQLSYRTRCYWLGWLRGYREVAR